MEEDSRSDTDLHRHHGSISAFFQSEIFYTLLVVVVVLFVVMCAFCCYLRRRQEQRFSNQRLTEIMVIRDGGANNDGRPKYTMNIRTDQTHATKLVQIITGYTSSTTSTPVLQTARVTQRTQQAEAVIHSPNNSPSSGVFHPTPSCPRATTAPPRVGRGHSSNQSSTGGEGLQDLCRPLSAPPVLPVDS